MQSPEYDFSLRLITVHYIRSYYYTQSIALFKHSRRPLTLTRMIQPKCFLYHTCALYNVYFVYFVCRSLSSPHNWEGFVIESRNSILSCDIASARALESAIQSRFPICECNLSSVSHTQSYGDIRERMFEARCITYYLWCVQSVAILIIFPYLN